MSLKQKAISGLKWTTLSKISISLIQIIQLSILARYLSPEVFGSFAIVMLVIGFCQLFADVGISSSIIHYQDITIEQLSTLYWLNILSSVFIYLLIVIFSTSIESFYEVSNLSNIIIITSSVLIIQSFGKQFFILFEKEFKFNLIAKIEIFASLSSLILAIYLARHEFGIYAIIYPLILSALLKNIMFMYFGLKIHKPLLYFKLRDSIKFIKFGIYQMSSNMTNFFSSQMDIILIGKLFDPEVLGLYSIAKQLVMKPAQVINPIVTRVLYPYMSKLQNNKQHLKINYFKIVNYLSSINFPIYTLMIILAPELINVFLGAQWSKAVLIFQILALYSLIRSSGNPIGILLLSIGKPNYEFYWNLLMLFITPLVIFTASSYGIISVCWSLTFLMLIGMIPSWYFLLYNLINARFIEYHRNIVKPFFVSLSFGIITFIIYNLFDISSDVVNILVVSIVSLPIIYISNFFFNKSFLQEINSIIKKKEMLDNVEI